MTGQPMACASTLVRPKVSGTVDAVTVTCAARKAAGMACNGRRAAPCRRRPWLRDETDQLLAIGVASGRVPGKDENRAVESAFRVKPRRRGDQVALALEAGEPRRVQHDLGVLGHAPV